MADMALILTNLDPNGSGQLRLNGEGRASTDGGTFYWQVDVNYDALAATINSAIKDAAISAAQAAGYTVGAFDKKTLYSAAVGL
ncbi:MAG: hypothetical protein ACREBG_00185 [Pyrinomonadaceae bacterium]